MPFKQNANTILLVIIIFVFLAAVLTGAVDLWTNEDVPGYITPLNATDKLCIGTACWNAYEVSIEHNASIAGSPICTPANNYCGQTSCQGYNRLLKADDTNTYYFINQSQNDTKYYILETTEC